MIKYRKMRVILLIIMSIFAGTIFAQTSTISNTAITNMVATDPNEGVKMPYVDASGRWQVTTAGRLSDLLTIERFNTTSTITAIPHTIVADCSSGSITLALPYGNRNGQEVYVHRIDNTPNTSCTLYAAFSNGTTCTIFSGIRIKLIWDAFSNKWLFDY